MVGIENIDGCGIGDMGRNLAKLVVGGSTS